MDTHFRTFTAEAMSAFGDELAAGAERRREFVVETRSNMLGALADFRRRHAAAEAERRENAARAADARKLAMSELRAGVHAMRDRFELARQEVAADLGQMRTELEATSAAFARRPGRKG